MTTNQVGEALRANTVARQIIDRVGDKWTLLVISALGDGPLRFSHLKERVEGINQRMLTQTLRGLERDGIVVRSVYPTAPPRVEYGLTAVGGELLDVVTGICSWTRRHLAAIEAARDDYDARAARLARPL
ncbi:helix-turn-helix transcriptional regulator [Actinomadura chibensis]|uniref:Helix-turn-helix transcriptional regulator n=1 Tax=Actinomadura chibensis TaxID=392828 RepID=A0A5D0NUD8_9ACTN|nr:helix-turn-helix transcriptional regulator [Actinomadura chibensis]